MEPLPVLAIHCQSDPKDPFDVTVTIDLAEHVAACCINPEAAVVAFHKASINLQTHFVLKDHRPGYQMVAQLRVPEPGVYTYRVVAKILGHSLIREGTYEVLS